jgi:hypothetical protein
MRLWLHKSALFLRTLPACALVVPLLAPLGAPLPSYETETKRDNDFQIIVIACRHFV